MTPPIVLPDPVKQAIGIVEWQAVTVGMSHDAVFRLIGDTVRYLKIGTNLAGEAARLRWLGQSLPVPQVLHYSEHEGKQYLLMSAIDGEMVHEVALPSLKRVQLMAEGLRLFHSVPITDCSFDWSLKKQLEAARYAINNGLISDDLDEPYYGMNPDDAFEKLLTQIPEGEEDLVVVHGDYCLPNILIDPETETVTGFIDLGRAGVADRYTDIAVGARSIEFNLGKEWRKPFIEAYGIDADPKKMDFYRKIDNFN